MQTRSQTLPDIRPPRPRLSRPLEALAWFVALGAAFGATGMLVGPDGRQLGLSPDILASSPFSDFTLPGLILGLVVGGTQLAAALALRLRHPRSIYLATIAAITLIVWLITQFALIGFIALQIPMLAIGLLELTLASLSFASREPSPASDVLAQARSFLAHGRVAIIGLSREPRSFSRKIATAMTRNGIDVVGVNHAALPPGTYATLAAIPDIAVRPVFIIAPASEALAIVEDAIASNVRELWFHHGVGLTSSTPAAIQRARDAGLRVISDLCPFMVLEPEHWLHGLHRGLRFHARTAYPAHSPLDPIR